MKAAKLLILASFLFISACGGGSQPVDGGPVVAGEATEEASEDYWQWVLSDESWHDIETCSGKALSFNLVFVDENGNPTSCEEFMRGLDKNAATNGGGR